MVIIQEEKPQNFNEMATSCHPKDKGGRYPMWIRVEYTDGEHSPPHAHLYSPEQRPSKKTLITKFLITDNPPKKQNIQVMKGKPLVPSTYAKLIEEWAGDSDEDGINNWAGLKRDWRGLEKTFK